MIKKSSHKLKLLFCVGYNGSHFGGFQKNVHSFSVEHSIERALHSIGLIHLSNFGHLRDSSWSRGSRTDKGVHAASNFFCCKCHIGLDFLRKESAQNEREVSKLFLRENLNWGEIVKRFNQAAGEELRAFGVWPVSQTFEVHARASSRRYEYLFPAWVLTKNSALSIDSAASAKGEEEKTTLSEGKGEKQAEFQTSSPSLDQKLAEFQKILDKFKGTHYFHNYTTKNIRRARECSQTILDISCAKQTIKEKEFVSVRIHGKTFIYHQIRKMIGAAIYAYINSKPEEYIPETLSEDTFVGLWTAPAEGLILDSISFDRYNRQSDIGVQIALSEGQLKEMGAFKEKLLEWFCDYEQENQRFAGWLKGSLTSIPQQ